MRSAIDAVLSFPGFAPAAVFVVLVIFSDDRGPVRVPGVQGLAAAAGGPAVVFAARAAVADDRGPVRVPGVQGLAAEVGGPAVVFAAKAAVPVCHASAATAAVLLVVVVDTLFLFDTVFPASVAADEDDNS